MIFAPGDDDFISPAELISLLEEGFSRTAERAQKCNYIINDVDNRILAMKKDFESALAETWHYASNPMGSLRGLVAEANYKLLMGSMSEYSGVDPNDIIEWVTVVPEPDQCYMQPWPSEQSNPEMLNKEFDPFDKDFINTAFYLRTEARHDSKFIYLYDLLNTINAMMNNLSIFKNLASKILKKGKQLTYFGVLVNNEGQESIDVIINTLNSSAIVDKDKIPWNKSIDDLKRIFKGLYEGGFISIEYIESFNELLLPHFKITDTIINSTAPKKICSKIKWNGTYQELLFFFYKLCTLNYIAYSQYRRRNKYITAHFCRSQNGSEFNIGTLKKYSLQIEKAKSKPGVSIDAIRIIFNAFSRPT